MTAAPAGAAHGDAGMALPSKMRRSGRLRVPSVKARL
jgi:hypothetical protein